MFRITAGAILVQIALGGLVTFEFIDPLIHMIWGTVVAAIVIVTATLALRSSPRNGGLRGVSLGMVAGILAQIALGFSILAVGSDVLAWIHLVLGVMIYAMSLTGMSFAVRQEYMSAGQPSVGV